MSLEIIKSLYVGKFFSPDSVFVNHKIVNIISIDDESRTANVVLQRYVIGKGASVSTNSKQLLNGIISYDELKKVNM
jgi:hypothetical protein